MFETNREAHDMKRVNGLSKWIRGQGLSVQMNEGENTTAIGLMGDTSDIDIGLPFSFDIAGSVNGTEEQDKGAITGFHPLESIIDVFD